VRGYALSAHVASATTRFVGIPLLPKSIATVPSGCRRTGGLRANASAVRCAGEGDPTGAGEGAEGGDVADHVSCAPILPDEAVDDRADPQGVGLRDLVLGHEHGSEPREFPFADPLAPSPPRR
jgi:hypothetical protein